MGSEYSLGRFKPLQGRIEQDDEELIDLLAEIERYEERHPEFKKPRIVDELKDFIKKEGFITKKQYSVLLDIYYKNKMQNMPEWE